MSDIDIDILYHDEVQLLDWGESRSTGPWVKLRLADVQALDQFRGLDTATAKRTGHIFNMTLAQGDIAQLVERQEREREGKGQHGAFWHDLIASGVFRARPVLECIGSEDEFEFWIRTHDGGSAIDGNHDWDDQLGEKVCDPAHVRRTAEGSGTSEKPPYYAIPLTHEQHLFQHQHGEKACLDAFDPETEWSHSEAAAWFEKKADHYRSEWASRTLQQQLAPESTSRSKVHPDTVRCWFEDNELSIYLPKKFRTFR